MSLKLTSRINLRGQGARRTLDFGQSPPSAPPTVWKGLSQVKKNPQFPQELLITPSGLQKQLQMTIIDETKSNYRRNQSETKSKVSLKHPSRINLGRRGTHARGTLNFGHNLKAVPLPLLTTTTTTHTHTTSLERAKQAKAKLLN